MMGAITYYAYCYKSGEIEFATRRDKVPAGTLIFAKGTGRKFRDKVDAVSRHHRTKRGLLLCPGLPEGNLHNFLLWHEWAFPEQILYRENMREVVRHERA